MKLMIIILLIACGLAYLCFKKADRPDDDFGAAVPALFFAAIAIIDLILIVATLILRGVKA